MTLPTRYTLRNTARLHAEADPGGSAPLLNLAEQKVVRKVRFCSKATKYVPKMSYFAVNSSKVVIFWARPQTSNAHCLRRLRPQDRPC